MKTNDKKITAKGMKPKKINIYESGPEKIARERRPPPLIRGVGVHDLTDSGNMIRPQVKA